MGISVCISTIIANSGSVSNYVEEKKKKHFTWGVLVFHTTAQYVLLSTFNISLSIMQSVKTFSSLVCPQGQPVKSENIFVAVKTCKKFHSDRGEWCILDNQRP